MAGTQALILSNIQVQIWRLLCSDRETYHTESCDRLPPDCHSFVCTLHTDVQTTGCHRQPPPIGEGALIFRNSSLSSVAGAIKTACVHIYTSIKTNIHIKLLSHIERSLHLKVVHQFWLDASELNHQYHWAKCTWVQFRVGLVNVKSTSHWSQQELNLSGHYQLGPFSMVTSLVGSPHCVFNLLPLNCFRGTLCW